MKESLLSQLIRERDELNAAINVLQRRFGAASSNGARRIMQHATTAIEMPASNGTAVLVRGPKITRGPYKKKIGRPPGRKTFRQTEHEHSAPFRGTGRDIATVPLPSGVSFDGIDFPNAVALAVKAVKEPIPTPELTLLLENAGVVIPHGKTPPRRYVGMIAANLKNQKRLAKTSRGWTKGTRA